MNNKELKKKECLFEIADDYTNGMDIYNHNGSFWLINTKELKWMIEFTKDKTLWYNYNIFKSLFKAMSLDVMKNQVYITEWFESRFLKPEVVEDTIQNGVKHTIQSWVPECLQVEDTIQNGVKHTSFHYRHKGQPVEDTIQNGVKRTRMKNIEKSCFVEDTIQNGVKHTLSPTFISTCVVEDTIQNGVKRTSIRSWVNASSVEDTIQHGVKRTLPESIPDSFGINDTIENGVKRTDMDRWNGRHTINNTIQNGVKINGTYVGGKRQKENVEVVIDYGVKETYDDCSNNIARVEGIVRIGGVTQNGVKHTEYGDWLDGDERIGDIAQNGVKVLQPLPAQDGNMDWGNYYHGKEDRTKPFNEYLNDAIRFGDQVLFPHNFNKLKNLQQ